MNRRRENGRSCKFCRYMVIGGSLDYSIVFLQLCYCCCCCLRKSRWKKKKKKIGLILHSRLSCLVVFRLHLVVYHPASQPACAYGQAIVTLIPSHHCSYLPKSHRQFWASNCKSKWLRWDKRRLWKLQVKMLSSIKSTIHKRPTCLGFWFTFSVSIFSLCKGEGASCRALIT